MAFPPEPLPITVPLPLLLPSLTTLPNLDFDTMSASLPWRIACGEPRVKGDMGDSIDGLAACDGFLNRSRREFCCCCC